MKYFNITLNILIVTLVITFVAYIGYNFIYPLNFSNQSTGKIMGVDIEYSSENENIVYNCINQYISAYFQKDYDKIDNALFLNARRNNDIYASISENLSSLNENEILISKIELLANNIYKVEYILDNTEEDIILKIDQSKESFSVYYDSLLESV